MEVLGQRISDVVTQGRWKPLKTSQNSPYISHLFFADNLLLFGKASSEQAQCMKTILADFCNISGQCVNLAKLPMWSSANTSRGVRHSISTAAQVPIEEELEVYLGVPCLHKRVNRSNYDNIVLKVRSKLAGWKMKTLFRTARAILRQWHLLYRSCHANNQISGRVYPYHGEVVSRISLCVK